MAVNNQTILNSLYIEGSNDFQQLLPDPTQHSIAQVAEAIFEPGNGKLYNMFLDALVNRIGKSIVSQNREWNNPLEVFDKGNLPFGFTVQDTAFKWIKAHNYDDEKETLLKMHRPEAASCFYSVDFQNYYPITVNEDELSMAFLTEDGLYNFVRDIMIPQMNSANYDLYTSTLQVLAEADEKWGLTKVHTDAISSKADSDAMLIAIKALTGMMKFPSCNYNSLAVTDIPVFCSPSECCLLTTPTVKSQIDVLSYAQLFNLDPALIDQRIIEVNELPAGWQWVLCDENFFQIYDKKFDTTSFYNPETLSTTYFLHVWKVIAPSPFANCVIGTTGTATSVNTVEVSPASITLSCDATDSKIASGDKTQLSIALTGTVDPDDTAIKLVPKSATFTIQADAVLNSRTYIDRNMVLHTQKTLATGTELTIIATSTYINPSGETTPMTSTLVVTIDNGDGETEGEGGGE